MNVQSLLGMNALIGALLRTVRPEGKVVAPRKSTGRWRAVAPAHAAKRARKAAGIVGHKASKRFYRLHRADYVNA